MGRYRHEGEEVEAMRFDGSYAVAQTIADWVRDNGTNVSVDETNLGFVIRMLYPDDEPAIGLTGDWVVQHPAGFQVVAAVDFPFAYEEVV